MKTIQILAFLLTGVSAQAFAACDADSVKADILKQIHWVAPLPHVVGTVSQIKMAGPDTVRMGNQDPYYEVLYSYHLSYVGTGENVREYDCVGVYQVDTKTCKIILGSEESVFPIEQP